MSVPTQKHVVAYALQLWGHVRPLTTLSARLVSLRPNIHVTLLTTDGLYDRVKKELSRSFGEGDEAASRVRLISIGYIGLLEPDLEGKFAKAWSTLASAEESLVCARSGTSYPVIVKPNAVIIDFFALFDIQAIKSISGNSVKIHAWYPGMVYHLLQVFGPEKYGGKGNIRIRAEEQSSRTGQTYAEAVEEIGFGASSEVVRLPGLPPMHDYENTPQDFPMPPDFGVQVIPRVYETLETLDGMFLITSGSYEPEAVAAAKAWMAEKGHQAYLTGPLLPPPSVTASDNEKKQSKEAAEIEAFLDQTLKTSGEKSLLYISFGSHFWPVMTPEKLWAFLDVVMELNIPFILSHASPLAGPVPDEVREKVTAYGKGLLSPWTPQQLILDHSATGWFVAHGGHNGLTEAIASHVPMILWPFRADQPMNAILMTDHHRCAYELLEVRSGLGLKTIYRTGYTPVGTLDALKTEARDVLTKAFGEDGKEKRAHLEGLRKAVLGEWEEAGESRRDVTAFLDAL